MNCIEPVEFSLERLNEVRREGYSAYLDDKRLDDNPYNTADEYHLYEAWKEGFYDAGWDD